jgi:hypothetical protein
LKADIWVIDFEDTWKRRRFSFGEFFGECWEKGRWGFRREMNHDRRVKVLLKVLDDFFGVFEVGLDEVEGSDAMELFTRLFDVEIESDVVLPEVFDFEEGRDDVVIGLIEYDDFPDVVSFGKDLGEELFLFLNQVNFRVVRKYHYGMS